MRWYSVPLRPGGRGEGARPAAAVPGRGGDGSSGVLRSDERPATGRRTAGRYGLPCRPTGLATNGTVAPVWSTAEPVISPLSLMSLASTRKPV